MESRHLWISFCCIWLFRYLRLIVNCIAHWTFRPIPIPEEPTYTSQDVTVIIPTIDGEGEELRETIRSCLRAEPAEILLVTVAANVDRAEKMAAALSSKSIRVLSVSQANKRRQMCRAIPEVTTAITLFADDDVMWPPKMMSWILAPFEDPKMGGVGTSQRLRREQNPNIWDFLCAIYLERRNFDISCCTHMDGGLPCLSGRTVAYRTGILQDSQFTYEFTHERWRTYQLNADDDNFITRWMVSHNWKTYVQYHKEAEVQTTLEGNPKFLKQCLRWSRSNWRSNLKSMFAERKVLIRHPWSSYAVFQTTITQWSFLYDCGLSYMLWTATADFNWQTRQQVFIAWVLWLLFTKTVKLVGHFVRYPEDILHLPLSISFGWLHGIIKLYAGLTLHVTTWGSRAGADTDDAYRMIRLPPRLYVTTDGNDYDLTSHASPTSTMITASR